MFNGDKQIRNFLRFGAFLLIFVSLAKVPAPQAHFDKSDSAQQTVEVKPVDPLTQPQEAQLLDEATVQPIEEMPKVETPAVAVVTHPVGCENYRHLVQQYNWNVEVMLAIAKAESSCRPEAKGDTSLTFWQNGRLYGYSVGLFQVRILPGREQCDTFEPQVNVECAYNIYKGQGFNAWTVFNTGAYRKYL